MKINQNENPLKKHVPINFKPPDRRRHRRANAFVVFDY